MSIKDKEKFDDNNLQLISELVKKLNEVSSFKNALIDGISSRIGQTPIQKIKQRHKQHMLKTQIQKDGLEEIIRLGDKSTQYYE
jgi:hypothetical protein